MTYTKKLLSGSINGKAIKIGAIATPGTAVHTAVSGTASLEEIWIYAVNNSAASVNLTLEWGSAAPDDNLFKTIPAYAGLTLVVPGLLLQNGLAINAFASVTDVVMVHGYVHAIDP